MLRFSILLALAVLVFADAQPSNTTALHDHGCSSNFTSLSSRSYHWHTTHCCAPFVLSTARLRAAASTTHTLHYFFRSHLSCCFRRALKAALADRGVSFNESSSKEDLLAAVVAFCPTPLSFHLCNHLLLLAVKSRATIGILRLRVCCHSLGFQESGQARPAQHAPPVRSPL